MTDSSTVLSPGAYQGWVYDPQHDSVAFITTAGALKVWNLDSQAYTLTLPLSGGPTTIDISADGRFLVVGNHDTNTATSPATASLSRIDLSTHAVDQILVPLPSAGQKGVLHLVAGADGEALFNRNSAQIGISPYTAVAIDGVNPSPAPVAALASLDPFEAMMRSDDHRYVVLGGGLTTRSLYLYDTSVGAIVAHAATGSMTGHGDVSVPAGLVIDVRQLVAYDLHLNVVQDLSSFDSAGQVLGATFSDDGRQLFLFRGGDPAFGSPDRVLVLDTQSWSQVGTISMSTSSGGPLAFGTNAGQLQVAGKFLLVDTGSQIQALDLTAREQLTVTATAGHHDLIGGLGADSLSGSTEHDLLTGGLGADTLSGGGGADDFRIAAGDSAATAGAFDVITDWNSTDGISFARTVAAGSYIETTAADFASAKAAADAQVAHGVDYVAVGVGADVYLFADSRADDGVADDVVRLAGRSLADIGFDNIHAAPNVGAPGGTLPPPPPLPTGGARAWISGDMDTAHLSHLLTAVLSQATETWIQLTSPPSSPGIDGVQLSVTGSGFDYVNNQLVAGTAQNFNFGDPPSANSPGLSFMVSGVNVPATLLTPWLAADATQTAFQTILAGSDQIAGSHTADLIHGYAGNDLICGMGGSDTLWGGLGDDVLFAKVTPATTASPFDWSVGAPGSTYLRGEEGADYIVGGDGFDDINGNQDNDTASGGLGDDWVVGGKDNDLLFGDAGSDIVYGNLGNDTCDGGTGADLIRGGQGDDVLTGGDGDDWLSGDRGSDTVSGGAGADTFHTFAGAGVDRVLDFNLSEGDRVQLDAGTAYTVSQVGADTVIDMGAGDQMILVGVQSSTLTGGWLVIV